MKKIKIGIFWFLFIVIQIFISIGLIYTLTTAPKTRTSGIEYNDELRLETAEPLVEKGDTFTQYFTPKYKYVDTIEVRVGFSTFTELYESSDVIIVNITDASDTELWKKEIPLTTVKNFIYVDLDVKKELKTDEIYALNIRLKENARHIDDTWVSAKCALVNSDLEENKDCFFNNTKLQASADVIYNYRYYDVIGIIKYLCGIVILDSVTYMLKKTRKKYCKKIIRNCAIILLPVCVYMLYENISGNLFTVGLRYAVLNIIILEAIYMFFLFLCGNSRVAGIIFCMGFAILGLVEYYVLEFRGRAFMLSDITGIKTATTVLESYTLQITPDLAFNLLAMLGIIAILWYIPGIKLRRDKKEIILRLGMVSLYIVIGWLMLNTRVMQSINMEEVNFWDVESDYQEKGSIYMLLLECQYNCIEKPKDYSIQTVNKLENAIDEISLEDDKVVQPENIILIMNESFSDMEHIGNVDTDTSLLKFFHEMSQNTTKGWLQMPVFGGGTAESEYEVLTGNTKQFLSIGSTAYELYCQDPEYGIPQLLKKQGYTTIALHPYSGDNWNRSTVYPEIGFDEFFSLENWNSRLDNLRWFASDQSTYNKIKEILSEKEVGEKVFTFLVTMQNHGDYSEDTLGLYEPDIKLNYNKEYPKAETYLSLINESDKALEELIYYLQQLDQPTMLIMFGDHYPNVEEAFYEELYGKKIEDLDLEETQLRYQTPYIIWTNYESESVQENMSANYLGAYILEKAGLSMSKYDKFLLQLKKEIPVIGMGAIEDSNGKWYDMNDLPQKYAELINNYKILQYNRIKDRKNVCKGIFS